MEAHSSTLAWKTPWMEGPGRLQSMGSLSQTWLSKFTFTFHFHVLEKEMATPSSVLAWRVPGTGEPGGLQSMELYRVGHDWKRLSSSSSSCDNAALGLFPPQIPCSPQWPTCLPSQVTVQWIRRIRGPGSLKVTNGWSHFHYIHMCITFKYFTTFIFITNSFSTLYLAFL